MASSSPRTRRARYGRLETLCDARAALAPDRGRGLLYLDVRAAVTLVDDLLGRVFAQRLAEHLPTRILPISAEPPQSLDLLVDREFERIAELLKPGRKASGEGMARIRSLLATEALADADAAEISEADVRRGARHSRGQDPPPGLPKLLGLPTTMPTTDRTVISRLPCQLIRHDDPGMQREREQRLRARRPRTARNSEHSFAGSLAKCGIWLNQRGSMEGKAAFRDRAVGRWPLAVGRGARRKGERAVSTHVHRDGAHQITVRDDAGREVALVEHDRTQITTTGEGPHLTPQMAHDLADELHQWASGQQTMCSQGRDRAR